MNHTPAVRRPILIAGPCAAETPEQIHIALESAKSRNVDFVRVSLWKPRTKPGFDGLKEDGFFLLNDAVKMGLNPATEVLVPSQAQAILDAVLPDLPDTGKLMLWIGARNQNHYIQQEVARVAAQDPRVHVMMKNQPWPSESHWEGIAEHALDCALSPENFYMAHRGFTADAANNPRNLRNVPDSDMAMRVREKTGVRMLLDLSHIAGAADRIEEIAQDTLTHDYDGMVIEVHHNPRFAWTDAKQQITWDQLDGILDRLDTARNLTAQKAAVLA